MLSSGRLHVPKSTAPLNTASSVDARSLTSPSHILLFSASITSVAINHTRSSRTQVRLVSSCSACQAVLWFNPLQSVCSLVKRHFTLAGLKTSGSQPSNRRSPTDRSLPAPAMSCPVPRSRAYVSEQRSYAHYLWQEYMRPCWDRRSPRL